MAVVRVIPTIILTETCTINLYEVISSKFRLATDTKMMAPTVFGGHEAAASVLKYPIRQGLVNVETGSCYFNI